MKNAIGPPALWVGPHLGRERIELTFHEGDLFSDINPLTLVLPHKRSPFQVDESMITANATSMLP